VSTQNAIRSQINSNLSTADRKHAYTATVIKQNALEVSKLLFWVSMFPVLVRNINLRGITLLK
jgi:hypothetical protein